MYRRFQPISFLQNFVMKKIYLEPDKLTAVALATSLLARWIFSWCCWRSSGWYAFGMYSFHAFLGSWAEEICSTDLPVALVTVPFSEFGKYRSGNVPSYATLYFARAAICKASGEIMSQRNLGKHGQKCHPTVSKTQIILYSAKSMV